MMDETVDSPTSTVVSVDSSRVEFLEKEIVVLKICVNKLLNQNNSLGKTNKLQRTSRIYMIGCTITNSGFMNYASTLEEKILNCTISPKQFKNPLEGHVIKVLGSIGMQIVSYDLVAIHRIGKLPNKDRKVIVRFINRKHAYTSKKNSKKLKNTEYRNIFISENLCPEYRRIFNMLYKFKKLGHIYNVWSYNGHVYFRISESSDELIVQHYEDIDYLLYDRESTLEVDGR